MGCFSLLAPSLLLFHLRFLLYPLSLLREVLEVLFRAVCLSSNQNSFLLEARKENLEHFYLHGKQLVIPDPLETFLFWFHCSLYWWCLLEELETATGNHKVNRM